MRPQQNPIVLVVDDDEAIRDNIAEILRPEGYHLWLAATADHALRILELDLRAPDVILLDLWLPGMHVERFVSLVKDRATWACAPIVLTTAADEADIPKTLPIDALLLKPFSIPQLLAVIEAAVRQHQAADRMP